MQNPNSHSNPTSVLLNSKASIYRRIWFWLLIIWLEGPHRWPYSILQHWVSMLILTLRILRAMEISNSEYMHVYKVFICPYIYYYSLAIRKLMTSFFWLFLKKIFFVYSLGCNSSINWHMASNPGGKLDYKNNTYHTSGNGTLGKDLMVMVVRHTQKE